MSKYDYYELRANRSQNVGLGLLIGGAAAGGIGLAIGARAESSFDDALTGGIIFIAGAASIIASVPVLISSSVMRHKARLVLDKPKPLSGFHNGRGNDLGLSLKIDLSR